MARISKGKPIYMTAVHKNHTNALKMSSTASIPKTNKMAKTTKKTETAPAVAAPTPAPAVEAKKTTTKKAKAEATVPTTAAPVVSAPAPAPAVAAVERSSEELLTTLTEQLKALSVELSTKVREAVRSVQEAAKQSKREQRDSKKKRRISPEQMTPEQRKAWEARRANNAFLVQRPLTDELSAFMGLPAGSKRSQTEVTKFVSDYVKSHNCYDPTFKRRIIPNAALAKLLRVDDKTEVTYLNLQRYLKVHFKKA
jgi:chromatin remodeling complex protein RSC6